MNYPLVTSRTPIAFSHYRADIDGLRAVAVLPVVLFHAGLAWLSGGYVGVDVFFVISGFLITGIIAREMAEKRFSILEFYRRRARRIFPALTVMTVATLVVAYFLLTPNEYVSVAESATAVSVFSSNFYFWKNVSYFQSAAEVRPLLHTWSLAVEEQYYVFFPLLLWLLNLSRRRLAGLLWLVAIGSLALSIAMVAWKPSAAFYLLPTRAWELMLGGLLALGLIPGPKRESITTVASLLGVALILTPVILYTSATPFPGLAAVPPVVGTMLIIWAGGSGPIGRALSWSPVVAVGQASYSIYLWHLPIFAFAEYLVANRLTVAAGLALSALSVLLGFLSLRFIELPFRRSGPRAARERQALIAFCGMPLIAALGIIVMLTNGAPNRLSPSARQIIDAPNDKTRHHAECMTLDARVIPAAEACHLGQAGAIPEALLLGDSHSMVTATALEEAALRRRKSFLFAAVADCPSGLGFQVVTEERSSSLGYCATYNREMLTLALESPNIRTVVISSRWTNWRIGEPANSADFPSPPPLLRDALGSASSPNENKAKWERGFLLLIAKLVAAEKKVVIVGPLPEPQFNVPHRLHVQSFGIAPPIHAIAKAHYQLRHRAILEFFDTIKEPGVSFVWPVRMICKDDTCPIIENGKPVYFDHNHLSVYGARKTGPLYDPIFD